MNYQTRCEEASKAQGIDPIIEELRQFGIPAESHQTGGFTMCAYVRLDNDEYIYATPYGASLYGIDDYISDVVQYDEEQKPETIAQAIANYINGGN